jgi:hypothetical protein
VLLRTRVIKNHAGLGSMMISYKGTLCTTSYTTLGVMAPVYYSYAQYHSAAPQIAFLLYQYTTCTAILIPANHIGLYQLYLL